MANGLRIQGHPVHPMLIPFPIALFAGALVADIIFLVNGNFFWYEASYVATGFGIVFALLAAVAGLFEFMTIPRKLHAKRTATIHALVNVGVVAIFVISFIFRSGRPFSIALPTEPLQDAALWAVVFLSLAGNALLLVGGWLGGHLVYAHGVGITQHAAEIRKVTQGRVPENQWRPHRFREDQPPPSRDEAH
jgi:uncharacterized membrane protein